MKLVGYTDKLSVEGGDELKFMVSSELESHKAELVRLIHGHTHPDGPGFKAEVVKAAFAGDYAGEVQKLRLGSYVTVPDNGALAPTGDFTLQMWIRPTTADKQGQTLISRRGEGGTGYALRLDGGHLTLEIGDETISTEHAAISGEWYFVAAVYDSEAQSARLYLEQRSGVILEKPGVTEGILAPSPATGPGKVLIAAELVDDDGE